MSDYNDFTQQPNDGKKGLGIAALVLGILAFFFNPCYVLSIVAIVLGAMSKNSYDASAAGLGKAGFILGISSIAFQLVFDLIITIFTFGAGCFFVCF